MDKIKLVRAEQSQKVNADWGNLTWYANAALGNSDALTVGKCVIKPGHENPLHSHPNCCETLVVIEGTIDHMIDNGQYAPMKAGDTITVPANTKHHARNTGKTDAALFVTFSSPTRETQNE
jgi:quercetin dioxygenase-like cupin family protein